MGEIKVAVLMRRKKDADYTRSILSECEGVTICDSPIEADAVVYETEILSKAEKDALIALAEHGTIKEGAKRIFKKESTLKKQLRSVRRKLRVKTNVQAIAVAYRLGLISLQHLSLEGQ